MGPFLSSKGPRNLVTLNVTMNSKRHHWILNENLTASTKKLLMDYVQMHTMVIFSIERFYLMLNLGVAITVNFIVLLIYVLLIRMFLWGGLHKFAVKS